MNIVINGRFLTQNITGVQRYAHEIVNNIDKILENKSGIYVTLVSPRIKHSVPRYRHIDHIQVGNLTGHAWEQLELPKFARGATLYCPGNTAPILSLLGSEPVIITIHDLSYKWFPDAYSIAFRQWYKINIPIALRHAKAIITVSESERKAITDVYEYAKPRMHVVQNGGLPTGVRYNIGKNIEKSDYCLYVGSLSKRKNFPGIFEVACILARERGTKTIFVGGTSGGIVGSGMKVPREVSSLITIAGQIDEFEDLISLYKCAHCLLFPSFYEASPLPPIEAMAIGCPVVASDIPSLRERCGNAAVYCNPNKIHSIKHAVEQVLDDGLYRDKLIKLGYERAAVFTWEAAAIKTLNIICNA